MPNIATRPLALGYESVYGTPVSPSTYLRIISAEIDENINRKMVDDVSGNVKGVSQSVDLEKFVKATIKSYLYLTDIGYFLKAVLGLCTTTGTTPNFVHTMDQAPTALPKHTLVANFGGVEDTRLTSAYFQGIKITSKKDLIEVSLSILAQAADAGSTYTESLGTDLPEAFHKASIKFGANLTAADAASATPLTDWEIDYQNPLEALIMSGTQTPTSISLMKPCELKGKFSLYFDTNAHLAAFRAKTQQAMVINITENANLTLGIRIPAFDYMSFKRPYKFGEVIAQDVEFGGKYDVTATNMIQAILKNQKSVYTS